ncbi:glycosyltransferase [Jiangella mangrovi]|uniref:Glycosyltransferase involved in cell wall biosynthesis n=1 Tax=Jiangella mangrovi TaxID=1524084 RepID=A0A7W9LLN6_9ACTN|nr:glycosyltransferase involved in cell wall biosynthesis [Jiangella mangrovi]
MSERPLSISLYEVPVPTTRSAREMDSLRRAGFEVAAVHQPARAGAVTGLGMEGIPAAVGNKHPLRTALQRKIRRAGEDPLGERQSKLWLTVLEQPTPQLQARSADLNILAYEWVAAAEALVARPAHVYWAADLDALPAAVWAAEVNEGSRLVFDAHELFTELDYLDPAQLGDWDEIARTFIPKADLVLTVCDGIADILSDRYGARRVEVVPNLAVPGDPSPTSIRRELGLPELTPLAVHVGNVPANRRPELAVELLAKSPQLHVAFVGEVRQQQDEKLYELAEPLGVRDRLHFVPPVPGNELVSFLRDADASLIMYSPKTSANLRLAMPNKLFDALAAGLPVVATEGTAAADYVEKEQLGATFADGDATQMAAAVEAVLRDEQMPQRIADRYAEFVWPSNEERLAGLITELARSAEPAEVLEFRPVGTPVPRAPAPSWRANPVGRAKRAVGWRLTKLRKRLAGR